MKILINALDDEEIILEWLQGLFPNDVYDLQLFKNSDDFIKAFRPDTDLIITDAKVTGYDLHEALKYFKTIRKNGLYIIVISGYVDQDFLLPLFPLGVNYVIPKTGNDTKWLNRLRAAVDDLMPRILKRAQLLV